jgi:hypothetical protein
MASLEKRIDGAAHSTRTATDKVFATAKSAVGAARSAARKTAQKVTQVGKKLERGARKVRKTGQRLAQRTR